MTTKAQKVLEDALALERTERADLAASLLDSLDEPGDAEAEAAWAQEIERRMWDVDTGRVTTVSWSEARQRILARRDDRRRA
jgi:putative addiction module component (TIGR02574 family)